MKKLLCILQSVLTQKGLGGGLNSSMWFHSSWGCNAMPCLAFIVNQAFIWMHKNHGLKEVQKKSGTEHVLLYPVLMLRKGHRCISLQRWLGVGNAHCTMYVVKPGGTKLWWRASAFAVGTGSLSCNAGYQSVPNLPQCLQVMVKPGMWVWFQ
jgi:hypothetical protein